MEPAGPMTRMLTRSSREGTCSRGRPYCRAPADPRRPREGFGRRRCRARCAGPNPPGGGTVTVVDPSPERSSSPGSGRAGRSATYFSQDHEFRIDFDHSVRLTSADEKVELDTTEAFKLVAGKETLSEWITNPKLLLVASYGEDNVKEAEDKGYGGDDDDDGISVWSVTLPKVKVFSWTVIPSFDISATVLPNGVVFKSNYIVLDGINIPDSLRNTKIEFDLFSQLYLEEGREGGTSSTMVAQNALALGVYLPRGLSRLPGVKRTGNIIVSAILNSVDRSAKYKLMRSFERYMSSKAQRSMEEE
mmetsp:Transcript_2567/g.8764  ORF Transcript_2567/g.8764 Transcript_2567/m.8764 type:complete len:304 (+) Transcript_2567:64-975(+)